MRASSLLLVLLAGCVFNNISAEERLRDSVVGYNDEVRWNRIDLAAQRVAPPYRDQFRLTHADWHEAFEIADSEIVHVQVNDEDRSQATSFVKVRWYDQRTMLLTETTLRQEWARNVNGYQLTEEEVTDGNERLLAVPERFRADDEEEGEDGEEGDEGEGEPEADEARASRAAPRAG